MKAQGARPAAVFLDAQRRLGRATAGDGAVQGAREPRHPRESAHASGCPRAQAEGT
jgi:hypothetical protein